MMAPSTVQRDEARTRVDSTELEKKKKKVFTYLPELIPAIRNDSWHHDTTVHRTVKCHSLYILASAPHAHLFLVCFKLGS